jgi:hypothetical protein
MIVSDSVGIGCAAIGRVLLVVSAIPLRSIIFCDRILIQEWNFFIGVTLILPLLISVAIRVFPLHRRIILFKFDLSFLLLIAFRRFSASLFFFLPHQFLHDIVLLLAKSLLPTLACGLLRLVRGSLSSGSFFMRSVCALSLIFFGLGFILFRVENRDLFILIG